MINSRVSYSQQGLPWLGAFQAFDHPLLQAELGAVQYTCGEGKRLHTGS